jgi:hypothetical protein
MTTRRRRTTLRRIITDARNSHPRTQITVTRALCQLHLANDLLSDPQHARATQVGPRYPSFLSQFSLLRRYSWLSTHVFDTNEDSTSVQPSPGAHRRCYLLRFVLFAAGGSLRPFDNHFYAALLLDCSHRHATPPTLSCAVRGEGTVVQPSPGAHYCF